MSTSTKTEKALTFFEILSKTDHTYECKLCKQVKIGKKRSNLVSHLFCSHRTVHDEHLLTKIDPIAAEKMQIKLLQCMVEKVTINSRPFVSINDSGYVKSIQDKLDVLKETGFEIKMNDKKYTQVKSCISETTNRIKEKIKTEVKGRQISVMLDIATKNHHSILGINVRYIINGKIIERCVGMLPLTEAHDSVYLANETKKCLNKFGINLNQVKSITTDNGANVVAIVDKLDDVELISLEEDEEDVLRDIGVLVAEHNNSVDLSTRENLTSDSAIQAIADQIIQEEALEAALDDTDEYDYLLRDVIGNLPHHISDNTFGIRCGAHTLQLIVRGGLKKSDFNRLIIMCRKIAKLFRTETFIREMRKMNLQCILPRLNVTTRWDSDYVMVIIFIVHFL